MAAAVMFVVLAGLGMKRLLDHIDAIEREVATASERAEKAARDARTAAEAARASAEARLHAERQAIEAVEQAKEASKQELAAKHEAEEARAEIERIRREREEELSRMQETLERLVETRRTALGLVMNLPESALRFDFDSAALKPEAKELLSRIAGVLLASEGYRIEVHGHTDDVGTAAYNLQLSERRAEAVKRYLVESGIEEEIITVKGFGKTSPLGSGTTEQDRARNRRVEIALTDTRIQYTGTTRH
jgi:outer membrane protein OmpA-like peptidoglycan-associated protein